MISNEIITEAAEPQRVVLGEFRLEELDAINPETGKRQLDEMREAWAAQGIEDVATGNVQSPEAVRHNSDLPRRGHGLAHAGAFMVMLSGLHVLPHHRQRYHGE